MKTQSAIINPVTLPPRESWTPAEEQFVECMAKGERCIIGLKRPAKAIEKGESANVVRADLIRFFAWGGDEDNSILGNNIDLRGAWVHNPLDLIHVTLPYALNFINCHFSSAVNMSYSECRILNLNGSHLTAGLGGDTLKINNDLFMGDGFTAADRVYLVDAKIGGGIFCHRDSTFKNNKGYALVADRIKVDGVVSMGTNTLIEGGASFDNASIGGGFRCSGALKNKENSALSANGIRVGSAMELRGNFSAEGQVRLLDAKIAESLFCDGGTFKNKDRTAFSADRIKVGGNLSLQRGFSAEGEVRFLNAVIGGGLHCDGSTFQNGDKTVLSAEGIKVNGNFFMRNCSQITGVVNFGGATIGRNVSFVNSTFNNGVVAQSTKVAGELIWRRVKGIGTLDLSFASVDVWHDDKASHGKFHFNLDEFSYARFAKRMDVNSRIEWLKRRPNNADFSPQPFEQAARVLFTMGYDNDARIILLEKERQLTEQEKMSAWRRFGRKWLWDLFSGYGYRLRKTLWWSIGVVVLGWWLFFAANQMHYIVPHQPVVITQLNDKEIVEKRCPGITQPTKVTECLFPEYPQFHSLFYSIDVFIPFFSLHQEPYWYPQPQRADNFVDRWFFAIWYWIEIAAGWLLGSLLLLSITGLLRPRQSSGDGK